MNYYKELELILEAKNPKNKLEMFSKFYKAYLADEVKFEETYKPKEFSEPSYGTVCKIVPPQNVPKRSNLTTNDEIRHFLMLEELLNELSSEYGDIEVHDALFEASQRTQTLTERMAVVPRYLEANGLDATPMILTKLQKLPKNEMIEKIIKTLNIILEEEIDHVKKGDVWFNYSCEKDGLSHEVYFEIIEKYYPQGFLRPKNLNTDARKEAGFSCKELNFMAKKDVC